MVDIAEVPAPIADALSDPEPGRLVRATAKVLPGAALTGEQIPSFAAHWRDLALHAIEADEPVLVVLGDSLSQGIGASSPARGYVGLLRRQLAAEAGRDIPVLNLSRSGARIGDVLSTQFPALEAAGVSPLLTVCTVGSNDLLRSIRIDRTTRRVRRLVTGLPARALVATVPAKGSTMAKVLNRTIRSEARKADVAVADVGAALTSWKGRFAKDGFHPNDEGYKLWFEQFNAARASLG